MITLVNNIANHKHLERASIGMLFLSIGNIFLLENILIHSFYISLLVSSCSGFWLSFLYYYSCRHFLHSYINS